MHKLVSIIIRVVEAVGVAAIVIAALLTIPPKLEQWRGMNRKRDEICAQIESRKKAISALKEKQQRFKSDRDFVEMVARENKRVQPGELVFIADPDSGK